MTPAEQLAVTKPRNIKKSNCTRKLPWAPRLKQLRERLRLSLDEVAEAAQLSKTGLWELEQGGDPMLSTAARLAEFFGKSIEEIWVSKQVPSNPSLAFCDGCFAIGKYHDYCLSCTSAWLDVGYHKTLTQVLAVFPQMLEIGLPEALQADHSARGQRVKENLNKAIEIARRVAAGSDEQKELKIALQKGE